MVAAFFCACSYMNRVRCWMYSVLLLVKRFCVCVRFAACPSEWGVTAHVVLVCVCVVEVQRVEDQPELLIVSYLLLLLAHSKLAVQFDCCVLPLPSTHPPTLTHPPCYLGLRIILLECLLHDLPHGRLHTERHAAQNVHQHGCAWCCWPKKADSTTSAACHRS